MIENASCTMYMRALPFFDKQSREDSGLILKNLKNIGDTHLARARTSDGVNRPPLPIYSGER